MYIEKFLCGNEFAGSDKVIGLTNPYTHETKRSVYKSEIQHVEESIDYLTGVFPKFRNTPVYVRKKLLGLISDGIRDSAEELARIITDETGKPIKYSRIEIERAELTFRLGSELCGSQDGEQIDLDRLKGSENAMGIVKRFPLGLILAITPWNFPVNLVAHKLSPALATGNVVLLKPATASLASGIAVVRIIKASCDKLGLDYCPVNVTTVSGGEIDRFVSDRRVKMVSFTGSSDVGWKLKSKAVHQRVSLELGGNAGVIVDESADIGVAASKIASGAFAQSGQSCISVQRVFVHGKIFTEFMKALKSETEKLVVGDPYDDRTDLSAMITEQDAAKIEGWIKEAIAGGAEIAAGGNRSEAVLQPTILLNTDNGMKVNACEVFAPLITVKTFDKFTDAVEMVNDSEFGLQAGVFTRDIQNALYAYRNIETGGVVINNVSTYRMDSMPYGGVKLSGNAREGVKYAMEEMTDRKVMVIF